MSVGDRIVFGEKRGTIRFIGKVPPFIGTWYGVDWDFPNAGKHDGVYKGVRYFHATYPESGSFVKSSEVNFGNAFVDALKEQYDYDVIKARQDYEISMKDFPVSVFDFADIEKVKRLQGPLMLKRVVNLSPYNISSPGTENEIENTCPNIMDLDLSNNLMTSWEQISCIAKQLKHLTSLTLNDSRLTIPKEPKQHKDAFANLQHMVMCRTALTWEEVLRLSEIWPQIETLKVPFCHVETLRSPELVLQNVTHLDIQGNLIYKWSEINKVGHLPRLETLNACATGITEVIIPREEKLFLKLRTLFLSENYIKNIVDIIDLNNLPLLTDLRLNKNPLTLSDKLLSHREKIISRIANLEILNGREIEPEERRSSEYDYLREFAKDWFLCVNDEKEKAKFLFENPRYSLLVQKYGAADVPIEVDPVLKSHLITVNLIHVTKDGVKEIIKKKVHLTLAVYKLITIAKRAFNITARGTFNLTRVSAKNPAIKVEMTDQLKSMSIYAVEDGDTIYVSEE